MAKKTNTKPKTGFYYENTVEIEINGVKKRCFKGDAENVKKGLANQKIKAAQRAEKAKAKE